MMDQPGSSRSSTMSDAKNEFVEWANQELLRLLAEEHLRQRVDARLGNIGNIMYVVVVIVGGVSDPGTDTEYLFGVDVIRSAVGPSWAWSVTSQAIGQMSMQVPMIALGMAVAACSRAHRPALPRRTRLGVTLVRARSCPTRHS